MGDSGRHATILWAALAVLLIGTTSGACAQPETPPPGGSSAQEESVEATEGAATRSNEQPDRGPEGASGAGTQKKVALLVGISKYPSSSGWKELHTEADLEIMRGALEAHGFASSDIHDLTDAGAKRADIEAAFRTLLIDGLGKGDIAFFHFSGHGHRLTDNNRDEIDGYDEVLVPYGAPQRPDANYRGEKHVRDDDLGDWLSELRRVLGPTGDVIISLDSCFSGSATRAIEPRATARGSKVPIGDPQPPLSGELGEDVAGGFDDNTARGTTTTGEANSELAKYAFFSASRHNELAFETRDAGDRKIGSLSYALGGALAAAGNQATYRELFDRVERTLSGRVRNQPQAEGALDRELFAGQARNQEAFIKVLRYDSEARTATLDGGALLALLKGSRVAVFPPGTRDATADGALAAGVVTSSNPFLAEVAFDTVAEGADIAAAWAFITERVYGSNALTVEIAGDGAWRAALETKFGEKGFLEVVDGEADVVVTESDGRLLAATSEDTPLFSDDASAAPIPLASRLVRQLDDYSRNRWLRQIDQRSRDYDVALEIRPCRLETSTTSLGETLTRCAEPIERTTPGGKLELRFGDGFEVALTNRGRKRAHVAILDLYPDGQIHQLWPFPEEEGADKVLAPDETFVVGEPFQVGEPAGSEMFKLMATDQHVDYRPITTENFQPGETRGILDSLFADAFEGTRASPRMSASSVGTASVSVLVVPTGE